MTLRLSWTGTADLRFTVYETDTGKKLAENVSTANPKSVTLTLQSGVAYHSGIWAYSGVGTYTFTLITPDAPPPPSPPPPSESRPNVVLINTDDQRADTIPYLPGIRRWLGEGGTTFRNAYVSTPSCCPSRATLMSGRYVHNNGQYGQQTLGFDLDLTTQRYLRDAGYFTGHAGKFLHWLSQSTVAPHWDRWTYFKGGYENVSMNMDGTVRKTQGYSTTITFDRAIEYLNDFKSRDDARPWYLHLAPIAPHSPFTPEPAYANAAVPAFQPDASYMEQDLSDKPRFLRWRTVTPEDAATTRTGMIRTLYSLDDQVDRLMHHLEATGELSNTLVIFTSDNGYMWGEHQLTSKFLPYRKSVEVPLLMRWPGHVAANANDDRFVTHVDIAPTILAAAGITQTPVALDGRDILGGTSRQQAFTQYFHDTNNSKSIPNWASLRTSTYQYTEYYDIDNPSVVSFREYYDMFNDPYQLTNLLADGDPSNDPETAALSQALQDARTCAGRNCP